MQKAIDTFKNLGDLVENVSLYYSAADLRKMVLIDPGKFNPCRTLIQAIFNLEDILLENAEHIKATARIFFMHDFTLVESKGRGCRKESLFSGKSGFPQETTWGF